LSDGFWELVESIITLANPVTLWITKLESDILRFFDVLAALNDIKTKFMLQMSTSPLLIEEQNILNQALEKRYNINISSNSLCSKRLRPKISRERFTPKM